MYRCPRCNIELSPDARFCPRCGFNQTNARMQKVAPQQAGPPASPSIQGIQQPISPTLAENRQQQENKDAVPPSSIHPVKTNTPPKPGKIAPATPPLPSWQVASQPGQSSAIPAHLTGLTPEEQAKQATLSTGQNYPQTGERPKDAKLEDKQPSADEGKAQGLSLTKRYVSEQETRHQPAFLDQAAPSAGQNHPQTGERPKDAKADEGKAQGFSLTKRYVSEQETRHQPAFPI